MPRDGSLGSGSSRSSGRNIRSRVSLEGDDKLAEEEENLKKTIGFLDARLRSIQEDRQFLREREEDASRSRQERGEEDACGASRSRQQAAAPAWREEKPKHCERCKGEIGEHDRVHKTNSKRLYHEDCWVRQEEEWKAESEKDVTCVKCGMKWSASTDRGHQNLKKKENRKENRQNLRS